MHECTDNKENSSIMFKCKKANVLSDVKKELNELQKEITGKTWKMPDYILFIILMQDAW